ncbi:MAG: DUF2817 domain-containing protein [Planctomycetes bacterium]|nr:DUF2817 domain-containing protein [Planctomycetota bacterium]
MSSRYSRPAVSGSGSGGLALLLLLASCALPAPGPAPALPPAPVIDDRPRSEADRKADRIRRDVPEGLPFVAGWSVENRPIHYRIYGRGAELVLVIGAIHGDEPASARLVDGLARHLEDHLRLLEGRTVALCAVANPDGLARGTRWNARGVDLNRNYPTVNFLPAHRHGPRPLSEPESQVLADLVTVLRPARVLSVHQPLDCIDHDGPAHELAEAMQAQTHLRLRKLGAQPGSLGSYVGETLGIPIVTLELPAGASDRSEADLWWLYRRAVLAFVLYPGAAAESGRQEPAGEPGSVRAAGSFR